ncbi:MAG: DNA-protecting protein DprA [Myxococcus sp.]|nr:DNA-protecting protein DprA [Myxococcus sp.]
MTELERRAVLAVWTLPGVGAKALGLLEGLAPRADWFTLRLSELAGLLGLKDDAREALVAWGSLEAQCERVEKALRLDHQRVCFQGDPEYPSRLAGVRNAPPLLFFRGPGAVAQTRGRVAVVGTRRPQREWLAWTAQLASACAGQGLVVTSGAAEGIDTAAHHGALTGRGITWAFVASGLDVIDAAPRSIVTRLLRVGGSVFSEYPPSVRAKEGLFVQRNRLISGSADVVVVVRGAADSGARHTAHAARTQQRPLLAVPASPLERGAELCQALLRDGARPCFDVNDVLRAQGLVQMAPSAAPVSEERGLVSDEAREIFAALPQGLFDMEQAVGASPQKSSGAIAAALMELELAGWLAGRSGRRYEKRE